MTTAHSSRETGHPPAIEVAGRETTLHRPIFITGLRKSGTSMTKELFDGHPDLYVIPPNELHFFRFTDHPSAIKDKDVSLSSDMDHVMRRLCEHQFISQLRKGPHYKRHIDMEMFDRLVASQRAEKEADVFRIIMMGLAQATRSETRDITKLRYVSKTVNDEEYLPELLSWFPDAKMLYVLRNPYGHFNAARWSLRSRGRVRPRRGEFSLFRDPYPYLGGMIARMKLSYYFMRRYRKLYPDHFHILMYDRLLQDPKTELRKVCEFLDIEFDECLLYTSSCGVERQKPGWTNKQRETSAIDPGPATKWREQISPLEIRIVNEYFHDVLDEFGFERIRIRASRLRPLSLAERPRTFFLNRVLLEPLVQQCWR